MRIDLLVSVLPKETDSLKTFIEEDKLKNIICKLLAEKGYKKFTVASSDAINIAKDSEGNKVLKVWKLTYFFNGNLAESVVIADTAQEAINIVIDGEFVTDVEKCEQITEKGKVLTWHQPD